MLWETVVRHLFLPFKRRRQGKRRLAVAGWIGRKRDPNLEDCYEGLNLHGEEKEDLDLVGRGGGVDQGGRVARAVYGSHHKAL